MDDFGCVTNEPESVFCHVHSSKVAVVYGLELSDHPDSFVCICGVLIEELDFMCLVA